MRGKDRHQGAMFSYVSLEQRVPASHPLRPLRAMLDEALLELTGAFEGLYSRVGRPSIPPEQLLRALLLQPVGEIAPRRADDAEDGDGFSGFGNGLGELPVFEAAATDAIPSSAKARPTWVPASPRGPLGRVGAKIPERSR